MTMAVNVGILMPQLHTLRAGAVLHAHPQIIVISSSTHLDVQLSSKSGSFLIKSESLLAWHKIPSSPKFCKTRRSYSRAPAYQDHTLGSGLTLVDPETEVEDSPPSTSIAMTSQETPSSDLKKIGHDSLVKSKPAIAPVHELRHGEFLENRMLYRQKFVIRSYEVGADKATSISTIFSFFQEISLCHVHLMGIAGDGFGATKAMNLLGLIWVVAKMHVEVEEFPKWPDVIEIDSWIARAGKNGMRRDWIVRRYGTNEVVVRATSTWCMMDSTTRRVCKMPDAARAELGPFFLDDRFVFQQRDILATRITKLDTLTAKYLSPPLKSCRADLDVNQHVSNLKYISWALQSVPEEHLETHNLTSITIEYRRECQSKNVVESLTSSEKLLAAGPVPAEGFWSVFVTSHLPSSEFTHLLRTQDSVQHEIVRARTTWRRKPTCSSIAECKI